MWKESLDSNMLGAWQCPSTLKIQTVVRTAKFCRSLLDVYGKLHPESIEQSIVHEGDLATDLGKTLFFDICGV